jgi:hypothetical protein
VNVDAKELEMTFPAGKKFFDSVLVRALYEKPWRSTAGAFSDQLFKQTNSAIETYFGSDAFTVRVVAGCINGYRPVKQA